VFVFSLNSRDHFTILAKEKEKEKEKEKTCFGDERACLAREIAVRAVSTFSGGRFLTVDPTSLLALSFLTLLP
jgi:hypothetical protein